MPGTEVIPIGYVASCYDSGAPKASQRGRNQVRASSRFIMIRSVSALRSTALFSPWSAATKEQTFAVVCGVIIRARSSFFQETASLTSAFRGEVEESALRCRPAIESSEVVAKNVEKCKIPDSSRSDHVFHDRQVADRRSAGMGRTSPTASAMKYRFVRHPMYSAVIPLLVGMSLWLGSFAGAIVAIVPTVLIGIRAMLEEKFLRRELPGYAEYIARTRFRMIPYVW